MINTLLTRTPIPYSDESYMGYCLRTAEANGFACTRDMTRTFVSKKNNPFRLLFSRALMEGLTGHKLDKMICSDGLAHTFINGHQISSIYTCGKQHSKICPECIQEKGYQPALYELNAVVACIKHQRQLEEHCPKCKTNINHNRHGLLECSCNYDLNSILPRKANHEVMDLQRLIQGIVEQVPLQDEDSETGMPFRAMSRLSLNCLLAMIESFGIAQFNMSNRSYLHEPTLYQITESAAEMFSDWPRNFHRFIGQYGTFKSHWNNTKFGEWNHAYENQVGLAYPEESTGFIRMEYLQYLNMYWAEKLDFRHIDTRSNKVVNSASLSLFSMLTGSSPEHISKRFAENSLHLIWRFSHEPEAYFCRVLHDDQRQSHDQSIFSSLKAAQFLGISTTLFTRLKCSGYLLQNYRSGNVNSYAQPDLEAFRNGILKHFTAEPKSPPQLITFKDACSLKSVYGKFHLFLLIKMLKGEIRVQNNFIAINDALLSKLEVQRLIDDFDWSKEKCLTLFRHEPRCIDTEMLGVLEAEGRIVGPYQDYLSILKH